MRPPPGNARAPGTVWRLLHLLHSLKQAPCAWARVLRTVLESWCMLSAGAHCTLYVEQGAGGVVFMATHIDDFDLAGSDREKDPVEVRLRAKCDVNHTADDAPFVGMECVTDPVTGAVTIHQQRYTEELLVEFDSGQAGGHAL
jgi:hypothetical protein